MPSTQASYQPLNGKEIRTILKKRICDRIDLIPLMKEGHAYHNASLAFSFTMTATPADCPVPTAEFEESMQAPGFDLQEDYLDVTNKAESLRNKKEQLLAQIEKIDQLLGIQQEIENNLNPKSVEGFVLLVEEGEIISAAGSRSGADEVRIKNGLPIPRIVKEETPTGGTKMSEKMINYDQL